MKRRIAVHTVIARRASGRSGAGPVRLLAVLILLLFAGDTLLPVLHRLAVQHRVCVTHGEWIHVDAPTRQTAEQQRGVGYLPGSGDHHHEHCEACTGTRHEPGLTLGSFAAVPQLTFPALVRRWSTGWANPGQQQLYRVAPKQGPPAFG